MKTSVIRHRVADFLKSHAPFDALGNDDLLALAGSGRVKFHESEEFIFDEGDTVGPMVWVIQQGRVEMLQDGALRDVLGAGDLLGLERFAGESRYRNSARTTTDVILYAVDAALFEDCLGRYPDVQRYLAAHFSPTDTAGFGRTSWLDAAPPTVAFLQARGREPGVAPALAGPLTTRRAVRAMVESGTDRLAVEGALLTAEDLAMFCHRNPVRLIDEIRHARSAAEMKPWLELASEMVLDGMAHAADVDDCSQIGAEAVAAFAEATIHLADRTVRQAGLTPPPLEACWMTFGATARRELVRPVWPNMAAVYDDSQEVCPPEAAIYFAALNGETASWMNAFHFEQRPATWPEGVHPCMPLSAWKRFFTETITEPLQHDLYARREFFDLSRFSGGAGILTKLREHIRRELDRTGMLIPLLANDTMNQLPPLTFFGGLVVELDGGERPAFNVETTALQPIADAARVFALAARRLDVTQTLDRLSAAAEDHPAQAEVFTDAMEAFRVALYHHALAGGPGVDATQLGRYDSRLLKSAFTSIQRLLEFTNETFVPHA